MICVWKYKGNRKNFKTINLKCRSHRKRQSTIPDKLRKNKPFLNSLSSIEIDKQRSLATELKIKLELNMNYELFTEEIAL